MSVMATEPAGRLEDGFVEARPGSELAERRGDPPAWCAAGLVAARPCTRPGDTGQVGEVVASFEAVAVRVDRLAQWSGALGIRVGRQRHARRR